MRIFKYFFVIIIFLGGIIFSPFVNADLSCTNTTLVGCSGTILLRMSGSTNAHPELPTEFNPNYNNNVICCTSASDITDFCSGNYKIIGRLSSATNGHFQENTYGTYANDLCLSSLTPGDEIIIGYQDNNCSGYDTTLFSTYSSDNGTVGDANAYTRKICGSVIPLSISFSISDNLVGFGNLSYLASRYATGDEVGSGTEVEAHTMSANTNADSGYVITVDGITLTSGSDTIDPIGGANTAPNPGTEQFGLRATVSSGTGNVSAPYLASGFALDTGNFPDEFATGSGDDTATVFSVRYLGNIDQYTEAGQYRANLTYIMTGTF